MKKKIDIPNITITQNAVIAINLDRKKKKEHIIIGEFDNVNRYIRGSKKIKLFLIKYDQSAHFYLIFFRIPGIFRI